MKDILHLALLPQAQHDGPAFKMLKSRDPYLVRLARFVDIMDQVPINRQWVLGVAEAYERMPEAFKVMKKWMRPIGDQDPLSAVVKDSTIPAILASTRRKPAKCTACTKERTFKECCVVDGMYHGCCLNCGVTGKYKCSLRWEWEGVSAWIESEDFVEMVEWGFTD